MLGSFLIHDVAETRTHLACPPCCSRQRPVPYDLSGLKDVRICFDGPVRY